MLGAIFGGGDAATKTAARVAEILASFQECYAEQVAQDELVQIATQPFLDARKKGMATAGMGMGATQQEQQNDSYPAAELCRILPGRTSTEKDLDDSEFTNYSFVAVRLDPKGSGSSATTSRYSELAALNDALKSRVQFASSNFPAKSAPFAGRDLSADAVEGRRQAFRLWLSDACSSDAVMKDPQFIEFFGLGTMGYASRRAHMERLRNAAKAAAQKAHESLPSTIDKPNSEIFILETLVTQLMRSEIQRDLNEATAKIPSITGRGTLQRKARETGRKAANRAISAAVTNSWSTLKPALVTTEDAVKSALAPVQEPIQSASKKLADAALAAIAKRTGSDEASTEFDLYARLKELECSSITALPGVQDTLIAVQRGEGAARLAELQSTLQEALKPQHGVFPLAAAVHFNADFIEKNADWNQLLPHFRPKTVRLSKCLAAITAGFFNSLMMGLTPVAAFLDSPDQPPGPLAEAFQEVVLQGASSACGMLLQLPVCARGALSRSARGASYHGLSTAVADESTLEAELLGGVTQAYFSDAVGDIEPEAAEPLITALYQLSNATLTAFARWNMKVAASQPEDMAALRAVSVSELPPLLDELLNTVIPEVVSAWCQSHMVCSCYLIKEVLGPELQAPIADLIGLLPEIIKDKINPRTTTDRILTTALQAAAAKTLKQTTDDATGRLKSSMLSHFK